MREKDLLLVRSHLLKKRDKIDSGMEEIQGQASQASHVRTLDPLMQKNSELKAKREAIDANISDIETRLMETEMFEDCVFV